MKQRNRKKIGIRAMRKLLNAWRYSRPATFIYLWPLGMALTNR